LAIILRQNKKLDPYDVSNKYHKDLDLLAYLSIRDAQGITPHMGLTLLWLDVSSCGIINIKSGPYLSFPCGQQGDDVAK